jgi:hypothetical protein
MDRRHPIDSLRASSVIRALDRVGKTATFYVVVFFLFVS